MRSPQLERIQFRLADIPQADRRQLQLNHMAQHLAGFNLHILRVHFLTAFTKHQPGRLHSCRQRAQLHLYRHLSLRTLQLIIYLQLFNIEVRQKLQLHRADDPAVMEPVHLLRRNGEAVQRAVRANN
ncbi:hypothetical protein D3C80_1623800 [compost metagenome]